ncbi:MAG: AAA family ATPase [Clostridiales bacterium]|nr:AAA family ATPase [Clostridiales bacterium]
MENDEKLLSALNAIDPSLLDYSEWIHIGMALKEEGVSFSVWDNWSARDVSRYHSDEMQAKWDSFSGSGTTGGTIIHMAQQRGWSYVQELDWDDGLLATYEETLYTQDTGDKPYQMTIKYLEAMFDPDETIGFVHQAIRKEEDNKWVPANGGHYRRVKDIIKDLKKYKRLEEAFGTINPEAGAWIRINPTLGPSDKDVTRYDYALAESDSLPIEEQKKLLIAMNLPIVALVESGGKSVHAIIKVDAKDKHEYSQRVSFLFEKLANNNFIVDKNNKNPSRLSRLPGAERKGNIQRLLATNIGSKSWLDWIDYLEGIDDDLPPLISFADQLESPPVPAPELIASILREGNKMIITGDSKSGKTCLSQELAVCIAEGKPWLGKFQCKQGRVLYLNLECQESSLFERFKRIYEANSWKSTKKGSSNIVVWNLRGHAIPLDKLSGKIIKRCRNQGGFTAIILDPLYKVQQGDENSAEAITSFCNALDKIAQDTGAAVIYDHHHPKGSMGERKAIDRGAGSGVFARDADAIVDLSTLSPDKTTLELLGSKIQDGEKPLLMSFVLRDFKDIPGMPVWFKFPIHYIDTTGLLSGAPVEGSQEDNLNKSSKRTSESERRQALLECFELARVGDTAKSSSMAKFMNRSTLYRYLEEFKDEFINEDGIVRLA